MAYKIMIDNEYKTEGGIIETIPVEYDGVLYESIIEAWKAYWGNGDASPVNPCLRVYIKEV